jgi:hypothetical protein
MIRVLKINTKNPKHSSLVQTDRRKLEDGREEELNNILRKLEQDILLTLMLTYSSTTKKETM